MQYFVHNVSCLSPAFMEWTPRCMIHPLARIRQSHMRLHLLPVGLFTCPRCSFKCQWPLNSSVNVSTDSCFVLTLPTFFFFIQVQTSGILGCLCWSSFWCPPLQLFPSCHMMVQVLLLDILIKFFPNDRQFHLLQFLYVLLAISVLLWYINQCINSQFY